MLTSVITIPGLSWATKVYHKTIALYTYKVLSGRKSREGRFYLLLVILDTLPNAVKKECMDYTRDHDVR